MTMTLDDNLDGALLFEGVCVFVWVAMSTGVALRCCGLL